MNESSHDFLDYLGGLETKTVPEDAKKIKTTYAAVMKKAGLKRRPSSAKKFSRVLLIAAAVVVCGVITAAAAGINFGDMFRGYFETADPNVHKSAVSKLTQSQLHVLDQSGTQINQSQTCNGTTVTIESAVSDKNNAYILFDVTAPKGTKLNRSEYNFKGIPIDFHRTNDERGLNSPTWNISQQKGASQNDNHKSFILRISSASLNLSGRKISLTLKDLSSVENADYKTVIAGSWNFDIILSTQNQCKIITVNKAVHYQNSQEDAKSTSTPQFTVRSINLSSLSAVMVISSKRDYFPTNLSLTLKDGTQVKAPDFCPASESNSSCSFTYTFDSPIDVNSVSSITIGDLTIPVS